MRLLLGAIFLVLSGASPVAASTAEAVQTEERAFGSEWRGDEDFYAAFVAYGRAEWMYRVFRNRHCSFEGSRKSSLSHVLDTTRERLDLARSRIEALWPGGLAEVRDVFRDNDPDQLQLCDNLEAAELAFSAALVARDAIDVILGLIERERRSEKGL